MGRKPKDEGEEDGGVPRKCSGCGKTVLDGDGNQRLRGNRRLERFCRGCWRMKCVEEW